MNSKLIAGLCLGIISLPATAKDRDFGDGLENFAPSKVLENRDGRYAHWSGIGRLQVKFQGACTATLLDTRSPASPADAPAYLLTSGHCIEQRNGMMVTNSDVEGTIKFNYFADSDEKAFALKRVNWSSMQGIDVAILELQEPLSAVIKAGIQPIRIMESTPADNTNILLVGAPLGLDTGHLRLAACTQKASGEVFEDRWVWRRTVKNQCRDARGGSSGGPILNRANNQVFAVLGTSTQGGLPDDSYDEEIPDGYPELDPETNYGNPVSFIQSCFVNGVLDQTPGQCPLFPAFVTRFEPLYKQYAKVRLNDANQPVYPDWDLNFSLDTPFYRYKVVDRAIKCEDPQGYSQAMAAKDAQIGDLLGPRIGMQLLCLIGPDSADKAPEPGLLRNALTLAVELQAAGPTVLPKLNIEPIGDGYTVRAPVKQRWHSGFSHMKSGPPENIDCNAPEGYRPASRPLRVGAKDLPMKLCTKAYDHNGQASVAREDLLLPIDQPTDLPINQTTDLPIDQTTEMSGRGTRLSRLKAPVQD